MMDPWQTSQGRHEWHADDGKDMGTVGLCQAPLFDVGLGEIFCSTIMSPKSHNLSKILLIFSFII